MDNMKIQDKMVNSNRVLYTPSGFAKKNLMHLQEIGTLQALSSHTSKRSSLASYLFFCVKSGSGILIYEGITYSLNAGDCVFLDCNKSYAHNTSDNLWCLQWAHFNGPNLNNIYNKFITDYSSPVFHPLHIFPYENILTELAELTGTENNIRDILISEKIMSLIAQIINDCEHYEANKIISIKSSSLTEIKEYLDIHFREKITLDNLAKMFYIDKYYLTRTFKQYYGTTINTYLQQQKITYAKHLLRFSDLNIDEIATECGIEDANYFSRLFKKIEGLTPGAFRRSWSGVK